MMTMADQQPTLLDHLKRELADHMANGKPAEKINRYDLDGERYKRSLGRYEGYTIALTDIIAYVEGHAAAPPPCPECASADTAAYSTRFRKCDACGAIYYVTRAEMEAGE